MIKQKKYNKIGNVHGNGRKEVKKSKEITAYTIRIVHTRNE